MNKIILLLKSSYIWIILALFYIPLSFGIMYSFQVTPKKGNIDYIFSYSNSGWNNLFEDQSIGLAFLRSLMVSIAVALIVTSLSLLVVYGLWKSKSRTAKSFVTTTSNIPLINPDIITGISLGLAFSLMFGLLQRGDNGAERVIIGHSVMIIPFGITLMYPRSEKFKLSIVEASKDLGYGPIRTWFKTYFRHMQSLIIIVFMISIALSFDDFIIARTTSKVETLGRKMYEGKFRPWVLALGTLILAVTLSSSFVYSMYQFLKDKNLLRREKWKKEK